MTAAEARAAIGVVLPGGARILSEVHDGSGGWARGFAVACACGVEKRVALGNLHPGWRCSTCAAAQTSPDAARRHVCGAVAENQVCSDLLSRGWVVFRVVVPQHHPDMVAVLPGGPRLSVEVRRAVLNHNGDPKKNRKGSDADHFAWVWPDGRIEYEPPLPSVTVEEVSHGKVA